MKKYILPAIVFIGFLLRIVALDKIPVGFTPDEASFGYDAYSILKTGRDQWGKTLPIVFESFGDYKSPLYTYLAIPSIAVFGLNKFSVRLPNALLGTAAIYVLYLLVKESFGNRSGLRPRGSSDPEGLMRINTRKHVGSGFNNSYLLSTDYRLPAIIASFLLAISPWHIMMSRGAFEANLTTFLLPLSLLLFVKGLKEPKYLIFSVLFASLNVFSYHSAKFVTPTLFASLILVFRQEIRRNLGKYHKIAALVLCIFTGIFILSLRGGSSKRMLDVNIFKSSLAEASSERIKAINEGMDPVLARVVYNKYQAGVRHFVNNYVSYFSPQFYFSNGPGESTYGMIPGRGVIYWFELPLIIIGTIYMLVNLKNRYILMIVLWLLLAPIPAALAIGPGYAANRAVILIPALQIVSALGLYKILAQTKTTPFKTLIYAFSVLGSVLFVGYFALDYFLLSPQKCADGMLYGNTEAVDYVTRYYPNRTIVVSRRLSEPHIYVAFVNKIDPGKYQINTKNWKYKDEGFGWVDQMPEYSLENYVFKNINFDEHVGKDVVLVGRPEEFPDGLYFDKEITSPNGKTTIVIIEASPQMYAEKI